MCGVRRKSVILMWTIFWKPPDFLRDSSLSTLLLLKAGLRWGEGSLACALPKWNFLAVSSHHLSCSLQHAFCFKNGGRDALDVIWILFSLHNIVVLEHLIIQSFCFSVLRQTSLKMTWEELKKLIGFIYLHQPTANTIKSLNIQS